MSQKTLTEQMAALEHYAKQIGDRATSIEDALVAYQSGVEAYKACCAIIEAAEQHIKTINADLNEHSSGGEDGA